MISGTMQAAPQTTGKQSAPMLCGTQDKGFSSVLQTSVNDAEKTANYDGTSPLQDATSKSVKEGAVPQDPSNSKNKAEDQQVQDPAGILRQLLLQMAVSAQQVVTQPAEGSQSGQTSQAVQSTSMQAMSDLAKEITQLSPAAQNASASAIPAQGENFIAALALNQDGTADKIDLKLFDKISANSINSKVALLNALKGPSQTDSMNAVLPAADPAKTGAELQSLGQGGKDAALLSKSALADETFSQFKAEVISSPAVESGDKGSAKAAQDIYAPGIQTQTSSAHEQSPVQETVPANRMVSLDEVISRAVDSGQKNLVVRIDPPDLGSMHIKLSLENGVLRADVRVDSSSVKDSFNLALPQIKSSLENSGIKVSEFHVDVREDQYRNGQERNNQGQQQRQDRGNRNGFSDFFA